MNIKKRIYLSQADYSSNQILTDNSSLEKNEIYQFENAIESFLEEEKLVTCLSSGTSAIHLALILAGVSNSDEVLCQSLTFVASINPITYLGASPVFIDSEQDTWNMCPIQLEKVIVQKITNGNKPKAIIVVHIFGMPAKMDEICSIAKKYNIILIEDAAEAVGSKYKNKKCGTFGEFGIYSFNQNKIITTSGGGALICTSEKDKDRAIYLATQAKENKPYYEHKEIGYNYRMGQLNAALGLAQLVNIEDKVRLRRINQAFYKQICKNIAGVTVFSEPSHDFYSNHWLSCILINSKKSGFTKEELRQWLEKNSIESRSVWKPMHLQPVFKNCEYSGGTVSEELFNNGLCLPSSSNLSKNDKERIQKVIFDFLDNRNLNR